MVTSSMTQRCGKKRKKKIGQGCPYSSSMQDSQSRLRKAWKFPNAGGCWPHHTSQNEQERGGKPQKRELLSNKQPVDLILLNIILVEIFSQARPFFLFFFFATPSFPQTTKQQPSQWAGGSACETSSKRKRRRDQSATSATATRLQTIPPPP